MPQGALPAYTAAMDRPKTGVAARAAALAAGLCAFCLFLSSCPGRLQTQASLRYAAPELDPAMTELAALLPGMTLVQEAPAAGWFADLRSGSQSLIRTDLYFADLSREVLSAQRAGELAKIPRYWDRTLSAPRLPPWAASLRPSPTQGFIPSASYVWGLFYNRKMLDHLNRELPATIEELESLMARAKHQGYIPVALGSSWGWPGSAWYSLLDLRINGGKAAFQRLYGKRPFDDAGGQAAARMLSRWRSSGWFSAEASMAGMPESIAAVDEARALFVLMGSFGWSSFKNQQDIGFLALPPLSGKKAARLARGELGGVVGFVIPRSADAVEEAVALVDAYLMAGSPAHVKDGYKLPVIPRFAPEAGIRTEEAAILEKSQWLIPQMDRIMPASFVQASNPLWAGFFETGSNQSGLGLARALQRAKEASRPR